MPKHALPNSRALTVDVLALLSGVNFGSVAKVLAAMEAVERFSNIQNTTPFCYEAVPESAACTEAKEHTDRRIAAATYVHELVSEGHHRKYPYLERQVLKLRSSNYGLDFRTRP